MKYLNYLGPQKMGVPYSDQSVDLSVRASVSVQLERNGCPFYST